ncbi:MAG: lysozyme inhibitor LprI family protein [Alphaproteobacteria bacterium]|jgi:uncharacterized protein YecT (DUF1311 family)
MGVHRHLSVSGLCAAFALCLAFTSATSASASPGPVVDAKATEACLAKETIARATKYSHAVLDCVGLAAQACMRKPGGETTLGMMECLKGELAYWDGKLNKAFANRLADAKASDAELAGMRFSGPKIEPSLRKMQEAWIAYRDAACLYERAQWMGGTGGGPATMDCHMQETARQALKLDKWWSQ